MIGIICLVGACLMILGSLIVLALIVVMTPDENGNIIVASQIDIED